MIAWMVYAAVVGGIVAVGGLAMERLAAALGRPRRVAWLAALTLAVVIPLTGGWSKPAAAPAVVESGTPEPPVTASAASGDFWSVIPALPVPGDMPAGKVALLVWGAGSLASLAVLAGVLVLVARGRRRWERRRVHGAEVYVSRRFGPALVGVARPEVVVPSWVMELEPGARHAIIRHENEHARARDHLVLLFGALVAAAFPWNPAIWWMYRRLRAAVELDCDQRVLASGIGVADYGDVLLNAGSRSRGRWGFAPAMGQPESLLERRLKTMSEKRRKPTGRYTALLVAVAVGAVVAACDTPVPTEVREAFEEVMADEGEQGAEGERADRVEVFLKAGAFGSGPGPMLFVDGVRIRTEADLPASVRVWFGERFTDAADIDRVEVIKGAVAAELYGKEGASGVIQVFTKGAEGQREHVIVPSAKREKRTAKLVMTEQANFEDDAEVTGQVNGAELAATAVATVREITVTGAELIDVQSVRTIVVTGTAQATGQVRELIIRRHPEGTTRARPVVYVDGVRLDGGLSSLNELSSEHIDRVEVIKGEAAREEYGEEGADGVILVFTKKKESPDKPSTRRPK